MLAAAGVRVTLYERAPDIAAGASGRNAGEICRPPDPALGPLFTESLRRYREAAGERLPDGTTLVIPESPIGVLAVAFDGDLVRRAAAALAASQPDLPPQVVDGSALRDLEPHLVEGLTVYRVDTGYPVRPADATHAFAAIARRAGASIVTGAEARPWVEDGLARGLLVSGIGASLSDWVVIAAGPWSPALIDPTGALAADPLLVGRHRRDGRAPPAEPCDRRTHGRRLGDVVAPRARRHRRVRAGPSDTCSRGQSGSRKKRGRGHADLARRHARGGRAGSGPGRADARRPRSPVPAGPR